MKTQRIAACGVLWLTIAVSAQTALQAKSEDEIKAEAGQAQTLYNKQDYLGALPLYEDLYAQRPQSLVYLERLAFSLLAKAAQQDLETANGTRARAKKLLLQAQAAQEQAGFRKVEAASVAVEQQARLGQAIHTIDTVDTLESQRPGKAAKVDSARLDLERTRVVAPFDAYVTNMNISVGAYAHPGTPIFTLIDTSTWYVIANYRESKLKHIQLGQHVDLYLMGHPDRRFNGTVESIGYGVFPEDGGVAQGLPDIDRTLNWVHLSTRFPVRIRVLDPDPEMFRIGATAVTVVR